MIKKIGRFVLYGTSHIAKDSIKDIEKKIEEIGPDVVALELDTNRFKALMSEDEKDKRKNKKSYAAIKELGTFGYLFTKVAGYVQKKVGLKIDAEPGVDMKGAYMKSRDLNIPVALIDIDIKTTMRKLSALSFSKKVKMFGGMLFKGNKKEYKELLNFDLKSVPDDETVIKMVKVLEKETPDLYNILIEDRNKYMVKRLLALSEKHDGEILAFVGAGHVDGMMKLLEKEMINNGSSSKSEVSFSFTADFESPDNL